MKILPLIFLLSLWHIASADMISWGSRRGTLVKSGFNNQTATYRTASAGGIDVKFTLTHLNTSPGKFTYSKWEIDRWGDPSGALTPPGSWQAVSDASNSTGLALWGYWGNAGTPLSSGDSTSYQLTIDFDQPVHTLVLPLRGINALLDTNGNNAIDAVTVASFLDGTTQASPTFS